MKGRRLIPLAAVAAAAMAFPALAAAKPFTYSVAAGEITSSTAKVWGHAKKKGKFYAEVAEDKRFKDVVKSKKVKAKASNDFTIQATIKKLKAGDTFYYHFCTAPTESKGDEKKGKTAAASKKKKSGKQKCSDRGTFETAPKEGTAQTIRFAFSGDTDGTPLPGQTTPFWGDFNVYGQMLNENNDFNINFGDTIYSDSSVGGGPPALTESEKWVKYQQNLAQQTLTDLRASAGFYSHWDDHEFINDFSKPEDGQAIYEAGVGAFTDYAPVNYSSDTGLYRSFRWGQNAELFFLDERSFRDAKASANGVCDNPQTNAPDLAPTAPPSVRNVFSLVIPSLAEPVSQQCLDTINDPNRTMLGEQQLNRFIADVRASTAKFKIIMNETPIMQFYGLPYDRWEGYAFERIRLLRALEESGVRNLVFLTTDTHAVFANVVRYRTLDGDSAPSNAPSGQPPLNTPYDDFIAGPVATNPFWPEIDEITGTPGSGELISNAFFKPPPPNGVGMYCSRGNVDSYAQVEVSSSALTLTYKDDKGQAITDVNGQPCGPFTIPAQ
jgi:phosphodiesterase/alkaline phosphatase D-like protein